MNTDENLQAAFRAASKRNGFDFVNAWFVSYSKLNINWEQTPKQLEIRVTDYLMNSDEEVLDDVAQNVYNIVNGHQEPFGHALRKHILSDDFLNTNRSTFKMRNWRYSGTEGKHQNLRTLYNDLTDSGMLKADASLEVQWVRSNNMYALNSPAMDIIGIPIVLDSNRIPAYVAEYAILRSAEELAARRHNIGLINGKTEPERCHFAFESEAKNWMRRVGIQ